MEVAVLSTAPDIASFLLELTRRQWTGVLAVVVDDGTRTNLYLKRGETVNAQQGTLGETLGRLLLAEGVLDREQYGKVIERMTERLIDDEQLRFGEAAVQLGFVTPEQVHEALALQVRRKLARCLAFVRVDCTLHETPDDVDELMAFPTPTAAVVLEGMREHYDERRLDPMLFLVADLCPRATTSTAGWVERFGMRGEEHRVTSRLEGDLTIAEIVRRARDPLAARRALACLCAVEGVELVPMAFDRDAPPDAVVVASAEAAMSPAPEEAVPPAAVSAEQPEARAVRAAEAAFRIARAVGRSSPPPLGERRTRLTAEQSFERGLRHAENGAWGLAKKDFDSAHQLMPSALEYELHASHPAFALGDLDHTRDAALDALDALAARALVVDRKLGFACYVRGVVAMHKGADAAALPFFREATRLDPTHTDASRHARLLSTRLGES